MLNAVLCLTMLGSFSEVPNLVDKYKSLQWCRTTTKNFEIVCIDKKDQNKLKSRVEKVKTWVNHRWNLEDVSFQLPCMIICVPTQEMFKDFFHKEQVDPKQTISVKKDVYAIWICSEGDWLTVELPEKIGRVCCMDYEKRNNVRLADWMSIGMSSLNTDVKNIIQLLKTLENESVSLSNLEKSRAKSVGICLFLKKEFAQKNPIDFSTSHLGFIDDNHFNSYLNTYVRNLVYDINHDKTPDSYLTWIF